MKMLKAKLYELEVQKRNAAAKVLEDSKSDVGWGNQIRSYVLDQSRIKDLRTNVELGNTDGCSTATSTNSSKPVLKAGRCERKPTRRATTACDDRDARREPADRRAPRQARGAARAGHRRSRTISGATRYAARPAGRATASATGRSARGERRSRVTRRGPHDGQARDGQGELRALQDRSGQIQLFLQSQRARRGLRRVQGLGPRRHRRRRRARCSAPAPASCR